MASARAQKDAEFSAQVKDFKERFMKSFGFDFRNFSCFLPQDEQARKLDCQVARYSMMMNEIRQI